MNAQTQSDDKVSDTEFENQWNKHIYDLTNLGFNLPDKEDRDKLEDLQDELKDLVAEASQNRREE